MREVHTEKNLISIIIPAFNEAKTIEEVIRVARECPYKGEVIVVSDGSKDDTANIARKCGVDVIELLVNKGKAFAMSEGVRKARYNIVAFLDADIIGFTAEMFRAIADPVLSGEYDMFVAMRGRAMYELNKKLIFVPILGGERVLTKSLWNDVPRHYKRGYQIEIALNYFAKHTGRKMGIKVMKDLSQVVKEKKRGLTSGLWQRSVMIFDIILITFRLYFLKSVFDIFSRPHDRQGSLIK